MQNLRSKSAEALLRLHYQVLDELKHRDLIRSANAPIGEYAEHLFCEAFEWCQTGRSHPGYDATDKQGSRIQIKARRSVGFGSRQLGSLRQLKQNPFDKLAAIPFTRELEVERAAIIPLDVVKSRSTYHPHTNSYRFMLDDEVWDLPTVQDATERVRHTAREI